MGKKIIADLLPKIGFPAAGKALLIKTILYSSTAQIPNEPAGPYVRIATHVELHFYRVPVVVFEPC